MCVIIHRQPKTVIPFEKLKAACLVNADGMGLIAFDRGKLELRKVFEESGNNPDTLQKFLEDAKDLHVYIHLRYRTKGAVDKSNVHPFGVLKNAKHGMDVQFMHNGTLSDFGTPTDCDSKHFVKTFLTPLSERFLNIVEPDVLIHDKLYLEILNKYSGRNSVFLLADSFGNHQITNYDSGKEFDGWWASNEYSFNTYHRESKFTYSKPTYNSKNDYDWDPDQKIYTKKLVSPQTERKVVTLPPVTKTTIGKGNLESTFNDEIPWTEKDDKAVKEAAKKASASPTLPQRERFVDIAEIGSLEEVCQLTRVHIEDLVEEFPDRAVLLILDLLKELYDRNMEYDDAYEAA